MKLRFRDQRERRSRGRTGCERFPPRERGRRKAHARAAPDDGAATRPRTVLDTILSANAAGRGGSWVADAIMA